MLRFIILGLLLLTTASAISCSANQQKGVAIKAEAAADKSSEIRAQVNEQFAKYGSDVIEDNSLVTGLIAVLPGEWAEKLQVAVDAARTVREKQAAIDGVLEQWEANTYAFAADQWEAYDAAENKDAKSWDRFWMIATGVLGIFGLGAGARTVQTGQTLARVVTGIEEAEIPAEVWDTRIAPALKQSTLHADRMRIAKVKAKYKSLKDA
jgi:hypothetical protein